MRTPLNRRSFLGLVGGLVATATLGRTAGAAEPAEQPLLLVTLSAARHVAVVDPPRGELARIEVGAAPWGIALGPDGRGYVATARAPPKFSH